VGTVQDQAQNKQKNNFCATSPPSTGSPLPITIQELVDKQQKVQDEGTVNFGSRFNAHPLSPTPGPANDRAPLVALGEGTRVTLIGYVADSAGEGPETVNCGLGAKNAAGAPLHDIHISIVDGPAITNKCLGIVAEMIPHHRPDDWTTKILKQVKTSNRQIRVTGNLMFDSAHTPCIGDKALAGDPSRASLWEVHPIYTFEVCSTVDCSSGDGFVPLDSWQPN